MSGLEGRVALVTGASRGIGRAIAIALAAGGAQVAVNYVKNAKKASVVVRDICEEGGVAMPIRADVSDHRQVRSMARKIRDKLGDVEILVNNAGIHQHLKSWEIRPKDWAHVVGTNLTSIYNTANVFVPAMIEAKWGRIVNVASVIAYIGTGHEIHYAASKGGVVSATKALALELAPYGVRVNAVAPGYIDTDMTRFSSESERKFYLGTVPMGRLGEPDEVAAAVSFLSSDASSYVTGQVIHVNGGLALL